MSTPERRDRIRTVAKWQQILHIKVLGEVDLNAEYSELEFERLMDKNGIAKDTSNPYN